jgi:hypothetical protein
LFIQGLARVRCREQHEFSAHGSIYPTAYR